MTTSGVRAEQLLDRLWGMKQLAGRNRGADPIPGMLPAHRYLFLWFYYYKCTMVPSHSGNLDSTCSSHPFLSTWAGPYRSVQTVCEYKTYLTETVQLIAYSDAVSPAVQELYRTMPGLSRMLDCLIHICKLQDAAAPFSRPLAWSGNSLLWRGPFWKSVPSYDCHICVFSGLTTTCGRIKS